MRVVFAGGGTGGHLFPGIALAEELPCGSVSFLCTLREFDSRRLTVRGLPHRSVGRWSVRSALRHLRERRADVVVGLGGGGSFPGLAAGMLRGVPVVCLEQNVLPGRVTRLGGRGAQRVYAQWSETRRYLPGLNGRFVWTGSPLRRMKSPGREESRRRYGLSPARPTVLVLGGSQGAETLNRVMPEAAARVGNRVQFLHLAGRAERIEAVERAYRSCGAPAAVLAFEEEMEFAYAAADLAVSRAGAMAIAELCRFRIPSLLIPYPDAADDHQAVNARALAARGAASWMREKNWNSSAAAEWISRLVTGGSLADNTCSALEALDRPDAGTAILADLRGRVLR